MTGFSNPCQLQSVKVHPVLLLGSFGNDDGNRGSENIRDFKIQRRERQRERQRNNRFKKQNNNFTRAITPFLYISFPLMHDRDVKMPNFSFFKGRNEATTKLYSSFRAWIWSLEIQFQEGPPTFDKVCG